MFYAEQVKVELRGFAPSDLVTLHAAMAGYASRSTFRVDDDGVVDTAEDAPVDGTYDGADADGPFWSMLADGAPPSGEAAVLDVVFSAEVQGKVVAERKLVRGNMAEGLAEVAVAEEGLVGVFVTPAADGPHPGLLTFGGSEGGLWFGREYARFFASLGYSCLGVAYFAEEGLPDELADIPLEYFGTALGWLKKRPEVKTDAIGVLGTSRGGELALLLGATFSDVKAVVAQVPSGIVWPGLTSGGIASAWTFEQEPLPYVPFANAWPEVTQEDGHTVYHYAPVFDAALDAATSEELDAATTRAEKTAGPILMFGGADDQLWPSCRLAKLAMDRLVASGHHAAYGDVSECYPDAGHDIGAPGMPTTGARYVQHPITGNWIAFGGTPAGMAHAARDAFDKKRSFLSNALR